MPTGKEIIERAQRLLVDEENVRWTLPEIVDWINEGVLAIVLAAPQANAATRKFSLAEGTMQSIQAADGFAPLRLLDIVRNVSDASDNARPGRAVTIVSRGQLDAIEPNWHDPRYVRFRKEARHYTFDEQNPLEFYVYPGNDGTGVVDALFSFAPEKIVPNPPNADPDKIDSYTGNVDVQEPYAVPLVDYVCYRALSKDDLQGAPGKAMGYYQSFANAVGIKLQSDTGSNPNARRAGT